MRNAGRLAASNSGSPYVGRIAPIPSCCGCTVDRRRHQSVEICRFRTWLKIYTAVQSDQGEAACQVSGPARGGPDAGDGGAHLGQDPATPAGRQHALEHAKVGAGPRCQSCVGRPRRHTRATAKAPSRSAGPTAIRRIELLLIQLIQSTNHPFSMTTSGCYTIVGERSRVRQFVLAVSNTTIGR